MDIIKEHLFIIEEIEYSNGEYSGIFTNQESTLERLCRPENSFKVLPAYKITVRPKENTMESYLSLIEPFMSFDDLGTMIKYSGAYRNITKTIKSQYKPYVDALRSLDLSSLHEHNLAFLAVKKGFDWYGITLPYEDILSGKMELDDVLPESLYDTEIKEDYNDTVKLTIYCHSQTKFYKEIVI
jgi:hypothetical protein